MRFTELYNLCMKHYPERVFETENELLSALAPFKEYFCFEVFHYDYVTFEDDGQKDSTIIELAKDVLRSHSNRYTLSVLCRKMNETGDIDKSLDDVSLKALLSTRHCFTIEGRSFEIIKLSAKGEEFDIEPVRFAKPVKKEEEKQKHAEQKLQKKLTKEQERLLRKAIKEEEKERRRILKLKKAEQKEERRVEKVKELIIYYQINDETTLEQLWADKLIRKVEYTKCNEWGLYTVGDVYEWVKSRHLTNRMDEYRKRTVERLLKIASFYSPEYVRLIPKVRFSGIQKVNHRTRSSQSKIEMVNDTIEAKKGDAIRWNYTKEEGIVIGFENEDGIDYIIVRRFNGTKTLFENDPKLFTILEGEERAAVIAKREDYVAEIRERKDIGRALIPKKATKAEHTKGKGQNKIEKK